jgi:hypothetical protein
MADPRSSEAIAWGVVHTPAVVPPGQGVWRCISVHGPELWGGRISTFLDVLGKDGKRVVGLPVRWFWQDGDVTKMTEPKGGEPWSLDFVMNAGGNAYGIQIDDGQPSDIVQGFGLGNFTPHHVFKVIYRYEVAGTDVGEPPVTSKTAAQAIDAAIKLLEYARGQLGG